LLYETDQIQTKGRRARVKMGVPNCLSLRLLSGVILALIIANASAQRESAIPKIQVVDGGLSPPYFNLADNRRIYASCNFIFCLSFKFCN